MTPLPDLIKTPRKELEKSDPEGLEKLDRFIGGEIEAFKKWSRGEVAIFDFVQGFTTKFLFLADVNPSDYKELEAIVYDICTSTVLGDTGTTLDGQKFDKRCQWKYPLK